MYQGHEACFIQLVQRVLAGSLVGIFVVAPHSGRSVFQVRGEDGLRAMDQKKWGEPGGSAWGGPEAPYDRRQLLELFPTRLVQLVENSGLEAL
jgi:hypothetical protein